MSVSEIDSHRSHSEPDDDADEEKKDVKSKDEVDFVVPVNKDANHNNILILPSALKKTSIYGDCEEVKKKLEKFSFLTTLSRRNSSERSKTKQNYFVKTGSFSRILGNTYNTKKYENELRKYQDQSTKKINFAQQERFYKRTDNGNCDLNSNTCSSSSKSSSLVDYQEQENNGSHHINDIGTKAFRTISKGIGKFWFKRSHSVEISTPDPEYKVSYLGNVLTGWAKGDGCVEKPLNTLWRNHTQNNKPDVLMRVVVCASGLKATTRQHGLTEYWANRITHCCAPKNFPRVFCWIYRHEGRKFKHELRCHAVLCSKESIALEICNTLRENLDQALRDFKREKILKQNARLSLANAAYDNPSLPKRKIMLSVGGNNYRPPLERSKSAPKLMAIEEAVGEEEGDDIEDTNEPEMPACCQKDSLYPAMTLGRRRCRRGHSIRRTGKGSLNRNVMNCGGCSDTFKSKSNTSLGSNSDEDELDKVLSYHNYNTNSPLVGELMSYFDMKLHKTSSLSDLLETPETQSNKCDGDGEGDDIDENVEINTDPSPKLWSALSLDTLDNCDEENASAAKESSARELSELEDFENDELYFRQAAILNLLHRSSLRKMANLSMSSDEGSVKNQGPPSHQVSLDSDEGSISSGCETASTVTTKEQESITPPPKTFVKSIKFDLKEEIIPVSRHEDGSDSDESGYVEYSICRKNEGVLV